MQFFYTLILASTASTVAATTLTAGQRISMRAIEGVFPRQTKDCKPITAPFTCERSCGAGSIQCVKISNCYNPSAGHSCCSNGEYCVKDTYCTEKGCCPVGQTLEECGATRNTTVILPPTPVTTPSPTGAQQSGTAQKVGSEMGLVALGGIGLLFLGL